MGSWNLIAHKNNNTNLKSLPAVNGKQLINH